MQVYTSIRDIAPNPIWDGILARAVHGQELTLAIVELGPNTVVAQHAHVNEQMGLVIRGTMTFTIGGEKKVLGPGEVYTILANVPHDAAAGPEGAVVIDIFAPVRQEWASMKTIDPRPPVWP